MRRWLASMSSMSSPGSSANSDSGSAPTNTSQTPQEEDSSGDSVHSQSLEEYTRLHSASSNDCDWLYELLSSNAISAGKVNPLYLVRVYYKDPRRVSTAASKDFGTGEAALLELEHFLVSVDVLAVVLCHRESSQVDPKILDLLWTTFSLDVSFMRHHFDYKEYREEVGCSEEVYNRLEEENDQDEDDWILGGRWNPIRLPSETRASGLRLSVSTECLSVFCSGNTGIVIAFVRSKGVYETPQGPHDLYIGRKTSSYPCTVDLYAAKIDAVSGRDSFPNDSSELSYSIVHFYARLLVLRCYEDYHLRHDTQPIKIAGSNRVTNRDHPHIEAMHRRRLELAKLKQDLSGYLGLPALEQKEFAIHESSDSPKVLHRQKFQGLLTDIEKLLSLYDYNMKIYEWYIHEVNSDYKADLASEQLQEAKASKATAISLGKLSNTAFLFLPINFVCAMLGMNLSIFGQGTVPIWVFFFLAVLFSLMTYLPIFLPKMDEQKFRVCKVAYHLTKRSLPAAFWFLAFCLTHTGLQNYEIMFSGLAQTFLGYTGHRTKGWMDGRNDDFFKDTTWGSQAFWKGKVKKIFLAVKELNPNNEPTELTV